MQQGCRGEGVSWHPEALCILGVAGVFRPVGIDNGRLWSFHRQTLLLASGGAKASSLWLPQKLGDKQLCLTMKSKGL